MGICCKVLVLFFIVLFYVLEMYKGLKSYEYLGLIYQLFKQLTCNKVMQYIEL